MERAAPGYIIRVETIDEVRAYWERHIHDLEITKHPVGSRGFFDDLDQYHFEKLHHLLRLIDLTPTAARPCWKWDAAQPWIWPGLPREAP